MTKKDKDVQKETAKDNGNGIFDKEKLKNDLMKDIEDDEGFGKLMKKMLEGMKRAVDKAMVKKIVSGRKDEAITDEMMMDAINDYGGARQKEGRSEMLSEVSAGVELLKEMEADMLKSNIKNHKLLSMLDGVGSPFDIFKNVSDDHPSDEDIIKGVEDGTCEGCPEEEECKEKYDLLIKNRDTDVKKQEKKS